MLVKYKIFIFSILLFGITACTHDHDHEGHDHSPHNHEGDSHTDAHEDESEDEVHLTAKQIETIELKTGTFRPLKTGGFIKANGVLDLPPDEFVSLTAPAKGIVKTTRKEYLIGSYVKKGTQLASLEHPSYIQMQQDYLEVLSRIKFQEKELIRQQTLNEANAGALKKLQEAEAALELLHIRKKGMKKQLQYLRIDADRIEAKGMTSSIALIAPISGYITALNIHKGQFVQPEQELFEIVNNDHIHLELDVFEKDISKIEVGQKVSFRVPSLGEYLFEGQIKLVGKTFNMQNKTVRVHGHIEGKHPEFIRGLYLEAKIWTDEQTVQALPSEAVILEKGLNYIFVKEKEEKGKTIFRKTPVKVGMSDGNLVEVTPLEEIPEGAEIVVKETFYLYASLNKGEHDHAH